MQANLLPGNVIAGKYRIERVLGEGAMGVVLLAHHLHLDERVAIKVPLPEAVGSPEAVARFVREARAVVKIKSEFVARVSDVGTLEGGEPYIVMEYLQGEDLSTWLSVRGPLAIEQAVEFLIQACEALADAHTLGIVHRDLKPANLFTVRRSDGVLAVKVLDFGISKASFGGRSQDAALTRADAVMGSPYYMSPEQMASSATVDARSDIWALGVVLFELLTARRPFVADTLMGLGVKIANAPAPPLSICRAEVPASLDRIVARCLEKERADRFQNVAELAQALLEFAPKRARASVERAARIIRAAGGAAADFEQAPSERPSAALATGREPKFDLVATQTLSPFGHTAQPRAQRPFLPLALGFAALGLVGAASAAWFFAASASKPNGLSSASARVAAAAPSDLPALPVASSNTASPAESVASSHLDPVPAPSSLPEVALVPAKPDADVAPVAAGARAPSSPAMRIKPNLVVEPRYAKPAPKESNAATGAAPASGTAPGTAATPAKPNMRSLFDERQ